MSNIPDHRRLLDKKDVLEILGISNNTLDAWERQGYIKRCKTPTVKYSRASIEKLEYDGMDNLLMSKDREIRELKAQLNKQMAILEQIKGVING